MSRNKLVNAHESGSKVYEVSQDIIYRILKFDSFGADKCAFTLYQ